MYRIDENNNIVVRIEGRATIEINNNHPLYEYIMSLIDANERLRYRVESNEGRAYRTRRSSIEAIRNDLSTYIDRVSEAFKYIVDESHRSLIGVLSSEFLQSDLESRTSEHIQEGVENVLSNYSDGETDLYTEYVEQLKNTIHKAGEDLEPISNKMYRAYTIGAYSEEKNAKDILSQFGIGEGTDHFKYFFNNEVSIQALNDVEAIMQDIAEYRPDVSERNKNQLQELTLAIENVIRNRYTFFNTLRNNNMLDEKSNPLMWKRKETGKTFMEDMIEQDEELRRTVSNIRFGAQSIIRRGIWNLSYDMYDNQYIHSENVMQDDMKIAKKQVDKIREFDEELQNGTYKQNDIEPTQKRKFILNKETKKKLKTGLAVLLTGATIAHGAAKINGVNAARSANVIPMTRLEERSDISLVESSEKTTMVDTPETFKDPEINQENSATEVQVSNNNEQATIVAEPDNKYQEIQSVYIPAQYQVQEEMNKARVEEAVDKMSQKVQASVARGMKKGRANAVGPAATIVTDTNKSDRDLCIDFMNIFYAADSTKYSSDSRIENYASYLWAVSDELVCYYGKIDGKAKGNVQMYYAPDSKGNAVKRISLQDVNPKTGKEIKIIGNYDSNRSLFGRFACATATLKNICGGGKDNKAKVSFAEMSQSRPTIEASRTILGNFEDILELIGDKENSLNQEYDR